MRARPVIVRRGPWDQGIPKVLRACPSAWVNSERKQAPLRRPRGWALRQRASSISTILPIDDCIATLHVLMFLLV